jgi:hypothetical protein
MNKQQQTPKERRLSINGLRKLRDYYLENLAQTANEIAAIDCELEKLNMQQIKDEEL